MSHCTCAEVSQAVDLRALRKEIGGIFQKCLQMKRNFTGRHFWNRGYCLSTVGLKEQVIREYIRNQEQKEKCQEQIRLAGL